MNKEEIKRMANTCENYHSCALCPYNPEDISRFIGDKWEGGCPNYDRKIVYSMGKGYRKIADDEIVIKKREINALEHRNDRLKMELKICARKLKKIEQAKQETAREILSLFEESEPATYDYDINVLINEIAQKYGIEW